jgi:hypothetical protein
MKTICGFENASKGFILDPKFHKLMAITRGWNTIFSFNLEGHEATRPYLMTVVVMSLIGHPCGGEPTTFVRFKLKWG